MAKMRDHGGDIDQAIKAFGGVRPDWLDLSTGINSSPYPTPIIPENSWRALPTQAEAAVLATAAAKAYGAKAPVLPVPGAQAAIQAIPRLRPPGLARVLEPTYNEHRAALESAGWRVESAADPGELAGADLAVVVNPNNPDGRRHAPEDLLALAAKTRQLVVDESFVDPCPALSLAPHIDAESNVIVLRSFGKFYGLAGIRLGFVIAGDAVRGRLREMLGPWAVSGPAIAIGETALLDVDWRAETIRRLERDAERLDAMATSAGWTVVGGTPLFRLYDTPDALAARAAFAKQRVWIRVFPYSKHWARLGLPHGEASWRQAESAFAAL